MFLSSPLSFFHFLLTVNFSAQSQFCLCSDVSCLPAVCVTAGPTVLEVFNTLLKHLRMSVDFELGESSRRNSSTSVSSGRGGKESRTPSSRPSVWFPFTPSVFWTGTHRPTSTWRVAAGCNQTSGFSAEMLLGWSSSCVFDSEDEIRINRGENVLLTSYKDPSLCVWALTHGSLVLPPGFFGGNLPDYQRAEVMMFIMGKVPVYGTPCHTLDTVKIGWVTHSLSEYSGGLACRSASQSAHSSQKPILLNAETVWL